MNILVVEDSSLAAKIEASLMKQAAPAGVCVDIAETGYVAEQKTAETDYDIILMDFGLPDCHGLRLTTKLRENGVSAMIVAVTSNLNYATLEERTEAGLDDGYLKPFSIEHAHELIAKHATWSERKKSQ